MDINTARKEIGQLVKNMVAVYSAKELLDLQLALDSCEEDLFFKALTVQLAEKYPESFTGPGCSVMIKGTKTEVAGDKDNSDDIRWRV